MNRQHEITFLREKVYESEANLEKMRSLASKLDSKLKEIEQLVNNGLVLDLEFDINQIIKG
jgi:hypothetical protein